MWGLSYIVAGSFLSRLYFFMGLFENRYVPLNPLGFHWVIIVFPYIFLLNNNVCSFFRYTGIPHFQRHSHNYFIGHILSWLVTFDHRTLPDVVFVRQATLNWRLVFKNVSRRRKLYWKVVNLGNKHLPCNIVVLILHVQVLFGCVYTMFKDRQTHTCNASACVHIVIYVYAPNTFPYPYAASCIDHLPHMRQHIQPGDDSLQAAQAICRYLQLQNRGY